VARDVRLWVDDHGGPLSGPQECPVTGEIYSAGGGLVARFFVGLTEGYANPDLTVEDVRGHFAEIRDETGYTVPAGVADEIASLVRRLG
jgi:hypothetical protein